jgi:type II secretory pathway pseudopilin PulG
MAALLVGLSIMAIMMTVALPAWSHAVRREREIELVWRGEQYQRAVRLFQRKFANTYPPTVDLLVEQKFLRKKYKDPITGSDFQVIPVGAVLRPGGGAGGSSAPPAGFSDAGTMPQAGLGQPSNTSMGTMGSQGLGIQGVVSKSRDKSIRVYNGASTYDAWFFIGTAATLTGGGTGGGNVQNVSRPGVSPNTGLGGTPPPFGQAMPFGGPGGGTPFGTPSSAPPAVPLFGAPMQPPMQSQPPGTVPGMTPPGGTTPFPGGTPVFGGGGTRPPVAPPPTWRPR